MDADLRAVVVTLAELDVSELRVLIAAINGVPHSAPGLLAWLEHATDWEQNRRRGLHFALQSPDAAIDPAEDAVAIATTIALRDVFASDSSRVARVFAVLLDLLMGVGRRQ